MLTIIVITATFVLLLSGVILAACYVGGIASDRADQEFARRLLQMRIEAQYRVAGLDEEGPVQPFPAAIDKSVQKTQQQATNDLYNNLYLNLT